MFAVTDPCQVWGKETKKKTKNKPLVQCELEVTRRAETLTICLKCKPAAWTGRSSGRGSNLEGRGGEGRRRTEKVRQASASSNQRKGRGMR